MQHYIVMRFLQSLLALLILSLLIFLLARATGDPLHLILPMQASEEDYANARRLLGLDKSWGLRYVSART
jgi:peptide/nickel transport system permease protein